MALSVEKALSEHEREEKTKQQKVMEAAVRELERLGGATFREDDIIYQGKQLVLPETMDIRQAIEFLEAKDEELTVATEFTRTFKYRPWDVAFCAWNVMRQTFGAVVHRDRTVQTMFGPMKAKPQLIEIQTSATETTAVPWGNFILPHLPEVTFRLDSWYDEEEGVLGYMHAEGPKRWRHAVHGVFELVERELRERSLYRGRPFDGRPNPQFLDLSMVDPEKMVFAQDTLLQLEASLWTPLRYRRQTERMGIPFKRAVLLAGDYGVGKSMAINTTAVIADECGVTFILVRPGRDDLRAALATAKMYQPSVVAFEDVDTVAGADREREEFQLTEILDLFDGIEAKNSKVMLVLTSNHKEKLHKGMMRPGRLDAIIDLGPPDAQAIRKLIEVNIGDRLEDDIDWEKVAQAHEGYLPAFVVESAQRAIRYALVRSEGSTASLSLTTEDLVASGFGMNSQYELMQGAKEHVEKPELAEALANVVRDAVRGTEKQVEEIHDQIIG